MPLAPGPAPLNTAILRCCEAYAIAEQKEKKKNRSNHEASSAGAKAFRGALPPLSGYENIRDFIACVAHGMLIGAIWHDDVSQLLYAAQVATSALRCQPKARETPPDPNRRKNES
ncbi:MAG: hypothetical protein WBE76_27940 [Terracidiphilus sp.]